MHARRNLVALALLASVAAAAAQDKPAAGLTPSKKGDRIAVYGCLRGGSLDATELGSTSDAASPVLQGMTFRLTGDKKLLKEMKEKHDKTLVEVHGILKSDLQPSEGLQGKLGGLRIGIGQPSTGALSAEQESRRAVPVVEVTRYEGRTTTCGR